MNRIIISQQNVVLRKATQNRCNLLIFTSKQRSCNQMVSCLPQQRQPYYKTLSLSCHKGNSFGGSANLQLILVIRYPPISCTKVADMAVCMNLRVFSGPGRVHNYFGGGYRPPSSQEKSALEYNPHRGLKGRRRQCI